MAVTIKDIAEKLRIDRSTVSRALRNDPRVRPETARKVNELARELGYRPNLAARYLTEGRTGNILFIMSDISNSVECQPAQSASNQVTKKPYDLLIACYHGDHSIFKRLLDRLSQRIADGALILPPVSDAQQDIQHSVFTDSDCPFVFVDRYLPQVKASAVTTDNELASAKLADMCIEAGAKKFILLYDDCIDNVVEQARAQGASERIKAVGGDYCLPGDDVERFLSSCGDEPVAIMASTQQELLNYYSGNPEIFQSRKVFFAVYDFWIGQPSPAEQVFVCEQDFENISRLALEKLITILEKKDKPQPEIITVEPRKFVTISRF